MTQLKTNCDLVVTHQYWNNSTSLWTALSGAGFYGSSTDNSIVITDPSSHTSYEPEVYYDIRVIFNSTYSELDNGEMTEEF